MATNNISRVEETLWIWENDRMIKKPITFVPCLYQIFDNIILSSIADSKHMKVKIDVGNDKIIIVIIDDEDVYDLPSCNFQDALHFSTEFSIKGAESNELFKEFFTNKKPTITKCNAREKWTMVSFKLDLVKFGMTCLEDDMVGLMKRRVVDLAGCSAVKVQLDGTCALPTTFEDYVHLYLQTFTHTTRIHHEKVNDRWEICVAIADGHFEHFDQVSFVNNIAMIKGGLHADYITRQITDFLAKKLNLEPNDIKRYLWVFVNARIDNPAFDSQTKGKLTVGSTCELTPEFLKNIADSLEDLFKNNNAGKLNIPKLQDAKLANTPYSQLCTLIITKGYFATDFVRSRLGEDKYGVFPLEGELLNVREASPQELEENTDIQNIKKILGLQDGKIYENTKELRYGHLMIMADEDHDGLRIKGLLINFLHYFWPSLLKVKNFMKWFIVPTVKVCHKRTNKVFLFYTMSQYKAWKEKFGSQFHIMFKELGTIESEGGYNLDQHIKDFVWDDDEDGDTIELAFSNMKIEDRKHWLQASEDCSHLNLKEKGIRYRDFMNKEFKQCAMADLQRSIPSMLDGLKPRERKILFYALKKPIIQEIGVGEFSNYVFGQSRYHDGEVTLVDTIIGMAQNYVGSNNINLLQPNVQFGTRYLGGKDHADVTLLFTRLSPITRSIFHENDELLLNYFKEDGQSIEPAWFIPIIPMVLVNGSEARGAWNSFIPNYNPRDIIANLMRLLKGQEMLAMLPWYKGFKGEILKSASNEYTTYGIIKDKDGLTKDAALTKDGLTKDAALTVTELPVRSWTQDYMEFLEAASRGGKDIKDYKAYDGDSSVRFKITMTEDQMNKAEQEGIEKYLKLTTTLSTANMYVFDADGKLKKYDTPEKLLEDFYRLRLVFYESRKTSLLQELNIALLKLKNKERFVREVWNGELDLSRKRKNEMCVELKKKGFRSSPSIGLEARKKTQEEEDVAVKGYTGYDYLLSNPILDDNDIEELEKERERTEKELTDLNDSTAESLWKKDLAALDKQLASEEYPLEAKYIEAENKARAKRAGDAAAGQCTNKKRRMLGVILMKSEGNQISSW